MDDTGKAEAFNNFFASSFLTMSVVKHGNKFTWRGGGIYSCKFLRAG